MNNEILRYLSQLTKFIFHIRTIMVNLPAHHHLVADNIQNTFQHWKYGLVNCHIDYFSEEIGQCHIYSIPFQMTRINGVTKRFFGNCFRFVVDIRLYDVHPFNHIYFFWMSCAIPLLKYLTIDNMIPSKLKDEFETRKYDKTIIISFPQLIRITLTNAHIDYVELFLHHTKTNLPRFSSLEIDNEKLVTVTNNFTSDLTRVHCAQLKDLTIGEHIVYPKHFYLYFPFLE